MSPSGQGNRLSYAGWVPTITGQLSFSVVGSAPNTLQVNDTSPPRGIDPPIRHVILSHSRRVRDLPWPFYYVPGARAEFVLIGATGPSTRPVIAGDHADELPDPIGVLTGRIIVIPNHAEQPAAARKCLLHAIRETIADGPSKAPAGTDDCLKYVGDEVVRLIQEASPRVQTVWGDFELFRTGEFRLFVDPAADLEIIGDNGGDADRFYHLMAKQMYYFAKDMAHRHYHHQDSSDNLLPLTPAPLSDDEGWRRETLWALSRSVLEMRRRNRLASQKQALGILAYAEAFQNLLGRVKREPDGSLVIIARGPIFDFTHTRLSLEATIEEQSFKTTTRTSFHGMAIATFLGAAALWIGAVQIKDQSCVEGAKCVQAHVPPWTAGLIRGLIEQPLIPFGLLFLLGCAYYEFTRRALETIPPVNGYVAFVREWAVALGASISRKWRSEARAGGDAVGNSVAFILAAAGMATTIYLTGALFQLWSLDGVAHLWRLLWAKPA